MKYMHSLVRAALPFALVAQAHAVTPGVTDIDGVLTNPFTGTDVPVWRLVGRVSTGCTMTQLSRHWALTAQHCNVSDGAVFTNPLAIGGTGSALVDCLHAPNWDWTLCRLKNPEQFQAPASYPPLTVSPLPSHLVGGNLVFPTNPTVGQFLGVGRSRPGFAAFVDGAYHRPGHNNAYPTYNFSVALDGGDSGGALYWISPTTQQAAYVGIMSLKLALPAGVQLAEQGWIDWVVNRANALGYPAPAVVSTQQHHGGTLSTPPPMLPTLPQVAVSGQSATITWRTPVWSGTPAITGYTVAMGVGDRMDRSLVVPAGQGNASVQTGLPSGRQRVCVTPYNSVGLATATPPLDPTGCTDFDTRPPLPVQGISMTLKSASSAKLRTVVATWQAPPASEVTTGAYAVTQTVIYPAGPRKTTTLNTVPPSASVTVAAGVRVCVAVSAISVSQVPAMASAPQCIFVD